MGKLWYGTEEEYQKTKVPFREVQGCKPRYNYHGDTINGERIEWITPKKMTNTWTGLQKEYNIWNKSRYRPDVIYFILDK